MSTGHGTSHIVQSLVSNLVLAAIKFVAALTTRSGSMLAEALHTTTDTLNQVLLLVGVKQARKAADARHPLGYGRELYFWSFLVALLLFSAGGLFSIYEGWHKLHDPGTIEHAWVGIGIFAVSFGMEVWVTGSNIREMNRKRGERSLLQFVMDSKESDFIVVFGENAAALLGTVFAGAAFVASWLTGDGRWDAAGSIAVGVILVGVAVFLVVEIKSLLIGESADPGVAAIVHARALEDPLVDGVRELITIQQGPGELLVALKVTCAPDLDAEAVSRMINGFEARLRTACPEVRWIFVEPDLHGSQSIRVPPQTEP